MDVCAELTLRLLHLAQHEDADAPPHWCAFPAFRVLTRSEASALLSEAPKPLVVAPLVEPGYFGIWPVAALGTPQRERAERELANRIEYFDAKVRLLKLGPSAVVKLIPGGDVLEIPLPEFLRWVREYYPIVGTSLLPGTHEGAATMIIRRAGGGKPPLGADAAAAPAAS